MSFYVDKLAFLPLRPQTSDLTSAVDKDSHVQPYYPSFVADLSDIHQDMKNLVDIAFLYDYFEPTVAILYEPNQTWAPYSIFIM
jgi:cleavage and polyadenylation specificity factor subunit 1